MTSTGLGRECPAAFERDPHRLEISRRDHAELRDRHTFAFDRSPLDRKGHSRHQSDQGQQRDRSCSSHGWQRRDPLGKRALECHDRVAVGEPGGRQREPRRQYAACVESRNHRLRIRKALRQHRHDDQEDDGERHFRDDERPTNPPASGRCAAAASKECLSHVDARRRDRRNHTTENAGEQGDGDREQQDGHVHPNLTCARQFARGQRHKRTNTPLGHEHTQHPTRDPDEQRFDKALARNPPS